MSIDYGKKIVNFSHIFVTYIVQHVSCPKKYHIAEKDLVWLGVKLTIELMFGFKIFCIGNRQYKLVHVKFVNFSDLFDGFKFSNALIEILII